jgi:hypothetical protein
MWIRRGNYGNSYSRLNAYGVGIISYRYFSQLFSVCGTQEMCTLYISFESSTVEPGYNDIGFNPFQSNFSATRILPSSYLFWAGKRLGDYL